MNVALALSFKLKVFNIYICSFIRISF